MYDLIVVGGGPAGTAAAISSARLGANVLLLERGTFPRHRVCGEFVSAESIELLHGLLSSTPLRLLEQGLRLAESRIFLDGRRIEIPIDPPSASISRFDLDAALFNSAQETGVEAIPQVAVQNITGKGPFRVKSSRGDFESRAVVNATGRWSNLNASGKNRAPTSRKWLGVKGHFREAAPSRSVDLYFFDGGYCGVQPVHMVGIAGNNTRVNACALVRADMVRTDIAGTLQEVFQQHPDLKERSQSWLPLSDPVSTFPLFFREPQPVHDGIFMSGDAAVFVDPFVGDGISLALRSGALAAKSLAAFFNNKISLAAALAAYREAYLRRFARVFKASSRIRRLLQLPRALRMPGMYVLGKTPRLSKYLVEQTR